MTRFFRSSDEILDQFNAQLDAAYNYPNAETKTNTTLPPPGDCPHDSQGRVYVAVDDAYCDFMLPSHVLPLLIEAGLVEEIDEAAYAAVVPTP